MEKILTIIIPTYNMEKFLDKCLTSLIIENKELLKKLEVIVVVDGAKDRSSEIAHTYQEKWPETFRVIDKENGNYGSCINRGLKEASGKYIKVLDADDWFETENIVEYLLFLEKNNFDAVITDFDIVDETGLLKKHWKINYPCKKEISLADMMSKHHYGIMMHAVTYRTQHIISLNYIQPEGISYTDQIWIHEPMASINSAYYLPIVIYKYLLGRVGQTMDVAISSKNMNHHMQCSYAMADAFLRANKESFLKYKFLFDRTMHTVESIYKSYLFHLPQERLPELIEYDASLLKKYPIIYEKLNESGLHPCLPYRYCKVWRKNNKRAMSIIQKLLYIVSKQMYRVLYRSYR